MQQRKRSTEAQVGERDLIVEVEGGILPWDETTKGAQYSPEITIGNLSAPYLALIMEDIDHESGGLSHWLLWNVPATDRIPRNIPKSAEIEEPIRGMQGRNELDEVGYSALSPQEGHSYIVRVYGLERPLDLPPASPRRSLEKAMDDHILQYGQVTVRFQGTKVLAGRATTP